MGRRALSTALDIKDGVVRGLLERLSESGVVSVTETGVQLSKTGKQSLRRFLRQLSVKEILALEESDLVGEGHAMGVHVSRRYKSGMTGIAQRDEAIKAGAGGSIIVASVGGKLVVPPDNRTLAALAPKENARLRNELKLSNNDLIIIGFGRDASHALAGALAAVLSFQGK